MKQLVAGILAHVDAGKTTLSEAMLYQSGALRALGRVDHQTAFLDTEALEKERGITIFSKEARMALPEAAITLLDTPGHVDFSSEMERTLQVLDYGVLVISGPDGVQGHTATLWRLLQRYQVPAFVFVNKMDQPGAKQADLLAKLKARLGEGLVDFTAPASQRDEALALCSEALLAEYLEQGRVGPTALQSAIARRQVFPCYFGSALKLQGVAELLEGVQTYGREPAYPAEFGAKVYKIGRDATGARLTFLKVTGGRLRAKSLLAGNNRQEEPWEQKADQLRLYSGAKFVPAEEVAAGGVCAVTGLAHTWPGEGLGAEQNGQAPLLEPVLACQVLLQEGQDAYTALTKLRQLEEEDPQLRLVWNEALGQLHLQSMGRVQLEVLASLAAQRFGLNLSFGPGSIVYRETIKAPVLGVGHFEPLRHYAEVHLLLEPLPAGSGLRFAAACSEDQLAGSWQRLVLAHLKEKAHKGVLTGAPITDLKITLVAGRAHPKHTEGGDFRQATHRAVRQGLMQAESLLLEPWYEFRLELPSEQIGRAMADLQRMGAEFGQPEGQGPEAALAGTAPVAGMGEYAAEVAAYTKGQGRLALSPAGYRPCPGWQAVVEASGYDPERDMENTPDSVFCAHGAGYTVKWSEAAAQMHVESSIRLGKRPAPEPSARPARVLAQSSLEEDAELRAIFERTYGPIRQSGFWPQAVRKRQEEQQAVDLAKGPEYLLVDGYNMIFAWNDLKKLAAKDLAAARQSLMDRLSNYQGYKQCRLILVFDAYKVSGAAGEVERYHNIHVVYTREAETADAFIEKVTYELGRQRRVRVATSDGAEQLVILGHGALRLSAEGFRLEVEQVEAQIAGLLQQNEWQNRPGKPLLAALEKAQRQKNTIE